ncbi:MAG: polyprenyl diphosphate synthase [Proteobacteria bacterium]|jgi:undecaprenyl diphosphate synthase|nr:polyprenyl diphosphate synthase [Pseudomonadota bacterium]
MNKLSHVAIIMDGNGRWALKRKKPRTFGHKEGIRNIKPIIKFCQARNVKFLTLFVFSLDNWKRSKKEVSYLFAMLDNFLKKQLNYLIKNKIKINFIGEKKKIEKKLYLNIKNVEKKTSKDFNITVNLAFNYSSKVEILNSLKKTVKNKKITNLTLETINNNLYTKDVPDPDILIRSGGYSRLSDFLLWQIAYSEIFFIKKLWPDFNPNDLNKIFKKYMSIKRNFGAVNV